MIRGIISGSTDFWLANNSRAIESKRYVYQDGMLGTLPSIKDPKWVFFITCSKAVLDLEANPLQLIITEEADPHEASAREDQTGTGGATEAIDERREAEGAVPHLDVVETALEWGLDVEFLIEQQLYPLTGQCWRKQSAASLLQPQRWFRDTVLLENGLCSEKILSPFQFSLVFLMFLNRNAPSIDTNYCRSGCSGGSSSN